MSPRGKGAALGVDIGGTKIETSLVTEGGEVLASHRGRTDPARGVARTVAEIVRCARECLAPASEVASAVGVGVAGQVDGATGVVRYGPNLGWRDVPLGARLERELGLPVVVANDVQAASWGEWRYGAGRGAEEMTTVFVGTGIGGGIISGGRLVGGCTGTAGEFGHLTLVHGGRSCRCGRRGCFEAYAGGWALEARAAEAVADDPEGGAALLEGAEEPERITAHHVAEARRAGDPLAKRLVDETVDLLASGLAGVVNGWNPCVLVLGGGIVTGFPELAERVPPLVRARALGTATAELEVRAAELGGTAGVVGAASLALDGAGRRSR